MRFVLAISALVLSGILLVLGIGQVTFLAGPRIITHSAEMNSSTGLAVIESDRFEVVSGQANVKLDGVEPVIAYGHGRDVSAWLAPFEHARVSVEQGAALTLETVDADAEAAEAYAAFAGSDQGSDEESESDEQGEETAALQPPSPRGSDLWLSERAFNTPEAQTDEAGDEAAADEEPAATGPEPQSIRLPVSLSPEQAVIVSVDPQYDAKLSIEWVQDRRTPWAGPLLVGGGVLALIGALLYLLAVDHDRRGLGPRRGRRGPLQGIRNVLGGSRRKSPTVEQNAGQQRSALRRRVALPTLVVAASVALSGCAPSYWPDFSEAPEPMVEAQEAPVNVAPVPVTQTQLDRVLADIAALSGAADDELDVAGLEARFFGDALTQREANYQIRREVSDYDVVVPRITDEALGYQLVQSTETWPRTVFVVVASESGVEAPESAGDADDEGSEGSDAAEGAEADTEVESPSLALIMTQPNPHANFFVTRAIALRGGITMPEAAPAEDGTARLADDVQTLMLAPIEVGPAYAAVLAGGEEVEEAALFDLDGDTLVTRSGAAWVAKSKQAAEDADQGIEYEVSAEQSERRIVTLSTGVGGALVATTVLETRTETPADGGRWRPTVNKSMEALSGLSGQQDKLISVVAHQMLFYVPSATSDQPIQLLGYTSDLVEVRNK